MYNLLGAKRALYYWESDETELVNLGVAVNDFGRRLVRSASGKKSIASRTQLLRLRRRVALAELRAFRFALIGRGSTQGRSC